MKIAAFGDCHIGSYGTTIDQETGLNARLLDTVESLNFVLSDARARGIDTALFAGDMYRNAKPTPTEICKVQDVFSNSGLCVEGIAGNHDIPRAANEETAIAPLDGFMSVLDKPSVHLQPGYWQLAVLPYPNRAQFAAACPDYNRVSPSDADAMISAHLQSILQGFRSQLVPGRPSVLMAHISVDVAEVGAERSIMAGRDITIPLDAIPEEFDFVVLSHIHKAQSFAKYGRPNVFYTGSTDRIDFGEEGEVKYYTILDLEAKEWYPVEIPCRNYKTFHMQMTDSIARDKTDCDIDIEEGKDAIVRFHIKRPENQTPDYDGLRVLAEDVMHCFDYRGVVEDVDRVASVRSENIIGAHSLEELLGVWHESTGCEVSLDELVAAGQELERTVA